MKPTKNTITQYLKDNLGHYINPFAVETTLDEDGVFEVAARWPDVYTDPDFKLEVSIEDTSVEEFSKTSGITTVEQLHFVSPHMLVDLFHKGIALLCVMIDSDDLYYELVFRKKGDKLYMIDEEEDIERVVRKKLETPEDYVEYTRNYVSKL